MNEEHTSNDRSVDAAEFDGYIDPITLEAHTPDSQASVGADYGDAGDWEAAREAGREEGSDRSATVTAASAVGSIPVGHNPVGPGSTGPDSTGPDSARPDSTPPVIDNGSGARRPVLSRSIMAGLTLVTLTAAVALLLRNVSANPSTTIAPVSVAAPAGSIVPISASPDTVVAPLNQVSFDPGPPEVGTDLVAYQAELSEGLRPVINVEYSDIVQSPAPWSSHLYGTADMPSSLSVPIDETGQALCLVAQVNLADLPALPLAQGNASTLQSLPRTGMLQFWLALEPPGSQGWTGGPTFAETADNPRQRVTYVSASDMTAAPAKRVESSSRCASGPPAKGPVVTLGMQFNLAWNAPETTDNRFDSSLPQLAGALRSQPDEFYRATAAINALLGPTPAAQFGGFNRLVNQDPRTVGANLEDEARIAPITDLYEVLFEVHPSVGDNDRWTVGFGNQGSGGWWTDPKDLARLEDPTGANGGKSTIVKSAFWWDGQVAPVVEGDGS